MGKRDRSESAKKDRKEAKKHKKEKRKSKSSIGTSSASPFSSERVSAVASLLPSDLKDVKKGAEDLVALYLLKYSSVTRGVLLAYDNLSILEGGRGRIINDLPYCHYNIEFDALLFTPKVGDTIKGVVTKSFGSHISMSVYHYFHASIQAHALEKAGYKWDEETEQWIIESGGEDDRVIGVDSPLSFRVDKIHEAGGILSLSCTDPMLL